MELKVKTRQTLLASIIAEDGKWFLLKETRYSLLESKDINEDLIDRYDNAHKMARDRVKRILAWDLVNKKYLVEWVGCEPTESTWEPMDSIMADIPAAVQDFMRCMEESHDVVYSWDTYIVRGSERFDIYEKILASAGKAKRPENDWDIIFATANASDDSWEEINESEGKESISPMAGPSIYCQPAPMNEELEAAWMANFNLFVEPSSYDTSASSLVPTDSLTTDFNIPTTGINHIASFDSPYLPVTLTEPNVNSAGPFPMDYLQQELSKICLKHENADLHLLKRKQDRRKLLKAAKKYKSQRRSRLKSAKGVSASPMSQPRQGTGRIHAKNHQPCPKNATREQHGRARTSEIVQVIGFEDPAGNLSQLQEVPIEASSHEFKILKIHERARYNNNTYYIVTVEGADKQQFILEENVPPSMLETFLRKYKASQDWVWVAVRL
ncbi:hypothetical protein Dda_7015 [Drechslerella dactyloides]|uniref:Chromo domain-containing protein n=1 Tax=Drechslerella dactyloides TaxID=74499 RepID=A0AAD6NH32_DREDA|nr:hypothetical protein Dda_7015 [Drechslerella dactyloides]